MFPVIKILIVLANFFCLDLVKFTSNTYIKLFQVPLKKKKKIPIKNNNKYLSRKCPTSAAKVLNSQTLMRHTQVKLLELS